MENEEYILYILMRTDLPSMNPGKAMAQASHASNMFVHDINNIDVKTLPGEAEYLYGQAKLWRYQTSRGFGTVLVLGCEYRDIENLISLGANLNSSYFFGAVVDPSYPYIVDTEVANLIEDRRHTLIPQTVSESKSVCFREEVTCAYAFSEKNNPLLRLVTGHLSLHP
jgi:hypothetical protein